MRPSDPWLRQQLTPARRPLVAVVATGVVSGLLVVGQAWVVTGLVLAVVHGEDLVVPAALVVGVLAARGLTGLAGDLAAARAAAVVGTSLRRRLVSDVLAREPEGSVGELSVLATRGVSAAEPYLTRYLPALVVASVLPPVTVVVIASQDLLSAVIVLATLPLVPLFGALVGLATRDRASAQWRELASLSGHFLDVVRGLPTLVVHRRARAQSARIAMITDRYRVASMRTLRIAFASSAALELVATLSVALVAVTAGVRLAQGSLDLRTALVVLLLAPEAYWPLRRVGAEFHAAAEGVATFEAVRDRLARHDVSRSGAGPAPADAPLRLEHVEVTRAGRTQPALGPVDALLPARGVTVVTGPSGCGKSTLLEALAGLLPVSAGTITAAGQEVGGTEWQRQVAWLPQRPHFVAGTLADNLRLGRVDATTAELWSALRQVALEERVRALPLGLDTPLGEDGTTLSAGERARLALARVVVAARPWMLLDEPTAHLDELTEQVIADTVVELGRRGAVVVVAHRPALVRIADHHLHLPPRPHERAARRAIAVPAAPAPAAVPPAPGPDVEPPRARFASSTLLSALASASGVALTATAGWLIVQASTHPPVLTMLVAIVAVRTFGLARPLVRYAERLRSHDAALRLLARRRVEVYDALVPLTPGRLGRRRGDLLSAVVDDVDSVVDLELRVRMPVRAYALVAAAATVLAALAAPAVAAVVATGALVGGAGAWGLARLGARSAERSAVGARAALSERVVEVTQLAAELRMWQATGRAAADTARLSDALGAARVRAALGSGAARAWVLVVAGFAMAAVASTASAAVASGALSTPMTALLLLLPLALAEVAAPLADAAALSVRTDAATTRLTELEQTVPAVLDTGDRTASGSHDVRVDRARGRWTPSGLATVECSLALDGGERVALVGPSGSGKSTLAALLVRFLDPVSGSVRHGGVDLRDLRLDEVRRVTGYVDDDPHVFATTVVENVRLSRPDASDQEVARALETACLGDWVAGLPDGLHTWLGDGHSGLSGGERARLGIARAVLADQPVLVLDEPAAHLDHATATVLAEELLGGPRTRALLWITHAEVGLDLVDRVVDLAPMPADSEAGLPAG